MNEAAIKKELAFLNKTIMAMPTANARKGTPEGMYLSHSPTDQVSTEETLEVLRLQIKYLLFDLEATRRENRYLRQMLESRPPHDRNKDKNGDDGPSSS